MSSSLHTHLESTLTGTEDRQDLRAAKEAVNAIDQVPLAELPFLDPILAVSIVDVPYFR